MLHCRAMRAIEPPIDEPIEIVAYNPSWPARFEAERDALEECVGPWVTGDIHHVGSTAVPGLDAKPIVDILVGVRGLEESRACVEPLARLDYLYAPYLPDEMHWFCKPEPGHRTHHLHLVPTGSQRFRDEIAFRDRLRADPGIASEYAALKRSLAERFRDDREAYTDAKGEFIRAALLAPDASALKVREATGNDAARMAAVHVRSWQSAYRGILPDELLDGLSVAERASSWRGLLEEAEERWLTLLAEGADGDIVGLCSVATPSRDDNAGETTAEVGALYIDPDHWREGAGSALLATALRKLSERGWHALVLWVLPENRAALAFYERFGFTIDPGVEKLEERSGRRVIRLRTSLTRVA